MQEGAQLSTPRVLPASLGRMQVQPLWPTSVKGSVQISQIQEARGTRSGSGWTPVSLSPVTDRSRELRPPRHLSARPPGGGVGSHCTTCPGNVLLGAAALGPTDAPLGTSDQRPSQSCTWWGHGSHGKTTTAAIPSRTAGNRSPRL